MRIRAYPIHIWFLDENLMQSASYLTNKYLEKTINGCYQSLVNARLYCNGIRTPKFYMYYFDTTRIWETLDMFFPNWPLYQAPAFKQFDSKESKWCRMCLEHYEYIVGYMDAVLTEYELRFGNAHLLRKFLDWETTTAPKIKLKYANIKKLVLPWKNINPKYRNKDIVLSYRKQYKAVIGDPLAAYSDTKRDIPSWIMADYVLEQ